MVQRGMGAPQIQKSKESKDAILSVLDSGDWHRYNEIVDASGLSTATVSKHLKEMEGSLIEKHIDINSGEYPYPVRYRLLGPHRPEYVISNLKWELELPEKTSLLIGDKSTRCYIHVLNGLIGRSTIGFLKDYFSFDEPNEKALKIAVDHFIIGDYYKFFNVMKNKLSELKREGKDIVKILEEADQLFNEDMNALVKRTDPSIFDKIIAKLG